MVNARETGSWTTLCIATPPPESLLESPLHRRSVHRRGRGGVSPSRWQHRHQGMYGNYCGTNLGRIDTPVPTLEVHLYVWTEYPYTRRSRLRNELIRSLGQ